MSRRLLLSLAWKMLMQGAFDGAQLEFERLLL